MKKVLNILGNCLVNLIIVLVAICLIFASYNFIQINVLNKNYTNIFGYSYFEIISGSMEDEISINDYVFVKLTNDVKKEDVISFIDKDVVVTHRVVEINGDELITKGDANNANDEPIKKNQIIGKVIFVGKRFGLFVKVITEPIVFISFFVTILLFSAAFSDDKKKGSVQSE